MSNQEDHYVLRRGCLSIVTRRKLTGQTPSREEGQKLLAAVEQLPSRGNHRKHPARRSRKRAETVLPIGCEPQSPSEREISRAAKYIALPYTAMEPPAFEAAYVVFALLDRMAGGDMDGLAEFERMVNGRSRWEELRG